MGNHRFDYPTAAAAIVSIEFDTAARLTDDADTLAFNDEYAETYGGSDQVRERGDSTDRYQFSAVVPKTSATVSDKADLRTFLAAVRRINTFQWTDDAGTIRTVRNLTNPIRFENYGGKFVRAILDLKVQ